MLPDFSERYRDAVLELIEAFPHKDWAKEWAQVVLHVPRHTAWDPGMIKDLLEEHLTLWSLGRPDVDEYLVAALTGTLAKVSPVYEMYNLGASMSHMRLANPGNTAMARYINQSDDPKIVAVSGIAQGVIFI